MNKIYKLEKQSVSAIPVLKHIDKCFLLSLSTSPLYYDRDVRMWISINTEIYIYILHFIVFFIIIPWIFLWFVVVCLIPALTLRRLGALKRTSFVRRMHTFNSTHYTLPTIYNSTWKLRMHLFQYTTHRYWIFFLFSRQCYKYKYDTQAYITSIRASNIHADYVVGAVFKSLVYRCDFITGTKLRTHSVHGVSNLSPGCIGNGEMGSFVTCCNVFLKQYCDWVNTRKLLHVHMWKDAWNLDILKDCKWILQSIKLLHIFFFFK